MSEWTAVETWLPNDGSRALGWVNGHHQIVILRWADGLPHWFLGNTREVFPTHWTPLPDGPRR